MTRHRTLSKSRATAEAVAVVGAAAAAVVAEEATSWAAAAGEATVCRWAVVEEVASAVATLAETGDISVFATDATIVMAA
ncbi:MAG TPA: hypothetical protein VG966_00295 [Hyphomicrobiaceae bacterium]|nr:hypothetical protein [Hyphomicrobiaceae bacterium]